MTSPLDPDARLLSPADVLTLGNAAMGFLAIVTWTIETGLVPGTSDLLVASVFIGLGLVLDSLDGPAARRWGGSDLGPDLDTLADLITFVVAPAVLVLEVYATASWPLAVPASVLLLLMGTLRLARYNSVPEHGEHHTFQGLPTPWAAVSVVILALVEVPHLVALPTIMLLALLMMSRIPYPKSRARATYATYGIAASAVVIIAGLLLVPAWRAPLLALAVLIAGGTITASPLLVDELKRGDDRARGDR